MQFTTGSDQETHRLPGSQARQRGKVREVVAPPVVVETLSTVVPLVFTGLATRQVVRDMVDRLCARQPKPLHGMHV